VPVHFTAFHPDFRLKKRPPTPPATLVRARQIAGSFGLKYVYTGNVDDPANQSTYCPGCQMLLIERNWFEIGRYEIEDGACRYCREKIPGVFERAKGDWGRKRVPVSPALLLGQNRL